MTDIPDEQNEDGGFWTGLVVGGILGAVAGFFLGGDDKNELKKKLKDKAFDVWDNLGETASEVKEKVLDVREEAEEEYDEVKEKAEEAVLVAKERIQAITDSAQKAVEEELGKIEKTGIAEGFRKNFFFKRGKSLQKKIKV